MHWLSSTRGQSDLGCAPDVAFALFVATGELTNFRGDGSVLNKLVADKPPRFCRQSSPARIGPVSGVVSFHSSRPEKRDRDRRTSDVLACRRASQVFSPDTPHGWLGLFAI
jgi:hypothetical protein